MIHGDAWIPKRADYSKKMDQWNYRGRRNKLCLQQWLNNYFQICRHTDCLHDIWFHIPALIHYMDKNKGTRIQNHIHSNETFSSCWHLLGRSCSLQSLCCFSDTKNMKTNVIDSQHFIVLIILSVCVGHKKVFALQLFCCVVFKVQNC